MAVITAHGAWMILNDVYKGFEKVMSTKLKTLCKKFETLLTREDATIQLFFNHVSIKLYGDTIEDKRNCTECVKESSIKI